MLARLLTPSDFGLYAVALTATQLLMMVKDFGVEAAIQHWRGPLDAMMPTATTISVAFSVGVYLIFFFGAPAFAEFAGNPEAASILRVLTAVVLVYGFNAVPSGVLQRNFRQKRLVTAGFFGLLVNATVAISMAISGAGAMSFAAGQVAGTVMLGVIINASAGVRLRFGFDRGIAAHLLRFGAPLALGLALEAALMNVDFVVIGRLMDATYLGYYLLAFNIAGWAFASLKASITQVAIAGFSRLSEMDIATMNSGVQQSVLAVLTVVTPICALTASLAEPIVATVYGERWTPASAALAFLAILTVFRIFVSLAHDIFMGLGATRWTLIINAVWATALVPAMVFGVRLDGIRGAAIAHACVAIVVAAPLTQAALRSNDIKLTPILPRTLRLVAGSVVGGLVAVSVASWLDASFARLVAGGAAGLVAYLVVGIPRADLRRWLNVLQTRVNRARAHRYDGRLALEGSCAVVVDAGGTAIAVDRSSSRSST